ncbi:hypothetical protein PR048_033324 [Dryococelus australis]|uniref:Uncharacterized protein n=1 Tax=Dryococelus australis TaxID=614101 RepID=A0ABQ9G180_9NEOP|nr:hypothetical protein PR048_033324 [Dryococelus australis]
MFGLKSRNLILQEEIMLEKAVHDKVSTFEINLRRKKNISHACIYFNGRTEFHSPGKVGNDGWNKSGVPKEHRTDVALYAPSTILQAYQFSNDRISSSAFSKLCTQGCSCASINVLYFCRTGEILEATWFSIPTLGPTNKTAEILQVSETCEIGVIDWPHDELRRPIYIRVSFVYWLSQKSAVLKTTSRICFISSKEIGHSTAELVLLAQEFSEASQAYSWPMTEVVQKLNNLEFSLLLRANRKGSTVSQPITSKAVPRVNDACTRPIVKRPAKFALLFGDKLNFKHVYLCNTFVIGSHLICRALANSASVSEHFTTVCPNHAQFTQKGVASHLCSSQWEKRGRLQHRQFSSDASIGRAKESEKKLEKSAEAYIKETSPVSASSDLTKPRVVRLPASREGEPGSIPGGVTPQIFACGNRAGRCRWSAGFLGDLQLPPNLGFRRWSTLALIGSQYLDAAQKLSLFYWLEASLGRVTWVVGQRHKLNEHTVSWSSPCSYKITRILQAPTLSSFDAEILTNETPLLIRVILTALAAIPESASGIRTEEEHRYKLFTVKRIIDWKMARHFSDLRVEAALRRAVLAMVALSASMLLDLGRTKTVHSSCQLSNADSDKLTANFVAYAGFVAALMDITAAILDLLYATGTVGAVVV